MVNLDSNGHVDFGRWDHLIQLLIVVSLITFGIETLPDLSDGQRKILNIIEVVTVTIFTIEYLLRLYYTRNKLSYALSFYGIIDILAILPFFLATGIDLRSIRAFRFLRLFRILKLARYSSAMQRYHRAFIIAREELILFGAASLITFYLASVGIYYFENPSQPEAFTSVFHSFWWAVATLTTVGYGDIYPITIGGKIFTFVVLMIGLGFVAVPTGLFASALSAARDEEKKKNAEEGSEEA